MEIKVYKDNGESTETMDLNPKIFGIIKVKPEIVHQVVTSILASNRSAIAHTKTRGEVRGGGKKPWQQKGTGRARAGSSRSPLWRGGGVTFGPRSNRNYEKKLNKKVKLLGLFSVLSDKSRDQKLIVLDNLDLEIPKTKDLAKKFTDLKAKMPQLGRKMLLVVEGTEDKILQAGKNLPFLKINRADHLNILDIIAADSVLVLKNAIGTIEKTYLK